LTKALNHTYVGTEHILLGLLREGDGVAARVLANLSVDTEKTRLEILKELDPNFDAATRPIEARVVMPQASEPAKPEPRRDAIDSTKRYDIYCTEGNNNVVVYRNALFKDTKNLFVKKKYANFSEFVELEQADGQTIFVSRFSIIKFCGTGSTPGAESVQPEK